MRASTFRGLLVTLCASACTTPADVPVDDDETVDTVAVAVVLPVMPEFPLASAGQVALVMASTLEHYMINASWDGWAGRCESTSVVQVLVQTEGYGFGLVLPGGVEPPASLPIGTVNDSLLPTDSVRVVVQVYPEDRAYVLKGITGSVELDSLSSVVSGRFSTTLVEGTYRDTVLAAGSFEALPIQSVEDSYCRPLMARTDSTSDTGGEPEGHSR